MADSSQENIPLRVVGSDAIGQPPLPHEHTQNQVSQTSTTAGLPDLGRPTPLPNNGRETAGSVTQPHIPVTAPPPAPVPTTTQPSAVLQPATANNAINATPPPQVPAEIPTNGVIPNQASTLTNGVAANPAIAPLGQSPGATLVQQPRKTFSSYCWSMKGPISLVVVYLITSSIIVTASDVNGPLARLGVTGGFLVLNILALLNNYALVAAGDKVWEYVQWGPLMRHGQNLTTFLALSTSSGIGGWLRIIFHGCHVPKNIVAPSRWSQNPSASRISPLVPVLTQRSSILQPRLWGLSRVGFWLLIQFPGLIFMTKVNPIVDYRRTGWERLSGGIGEYNVTQAATGVANGASLSGLALNIIRDGTLTKLMPAVGQECTSSSNCTSYILPGGMKSMSPWKFLSENGSTLPVYITRRTPVYQLDFWDAGLIPWAEKDCTLFGSYGTSGSSTSGFQICMTPYNDGQILAAFKFCNDLIASDGSCTYQDGWRRAATWSGFVGIYRRNATVAIERKTGVLLDIEDLSAAKAQHIPPADFLTAFKGMLLPWREQNRSFEFDTSGPQFQLTMQIAVLLDRSRSATYQVEPREIMRNIFMVPLYFYNPLTTPFIPQTAITEIATDSPKENYIDGSYAHKVNRLEISWWTVLTYMIVCGMILILIILILALTAWNQVQETSDYPFVDFMNLKRETSMANRNTRVPGSHDDVETIFANCAVGESGSIIEASRGVRIVAGARAMARNTPPTHVI
ncbi:hypothetical protein BKA65DRAFT_577974 [Rhexocercosporidium sp. MPI-PUGE-AT-0058]|nr:hypothetical protein BKA65DRAFT_577974 [Rhexocercosporidium sp. MPI-PUGE-AT-0058]